MYSDVYEDQSASKGLTREQRWYHKPTPEVSVYQRPLEKHFMLAFLSEDREVCELMNVCIRRVLNNWEMSPSHEIGELNEPGFHAWKVWQKADQALMEAFIPEVTAMYEDLIGAERRILEGRSV